ncbi:AAA-like domain-containing protein [Aerosakkonema sp. BLCC-F183]|uniref:AAA-like domain-containing protein n=1 Tax=Aerosakkonema sp. BLCC-F183 TaxID=3342834 RepID=UPI0035BB11D4
MYITNKYYQIKGGSLDYHHPTYVERDADKKLLDFIQNSPNRLCFVLAPPQMGKSSLMVRTANQLPREKFVCVQYNLQGIGKIESSEEFYYTILYNIYEQIIQQLEGKECLLEKLDLYWDKPNIADAQKFKDFLVKEALMAIGERSLVIYLDEVQSLITLNLQNSFLGFMNALSEDKTTKPLQRLKFILLGVAKASDLITDRNFAANTGEFIELTGLSLNSKPLLAGLTNFPKTRRSEVLKAILWWTGGQPFLTQLVCALVANSELSRYGVSIPDYVNRIVIREIIDQWPKIDRQSHFQSIQNYFFLTDKTENKIAENLKCLALYREIFDEKYVCLDATNPIQMDLLISGIIVKSQENTLRVSNEIYRRIFNKNWILKIESFLQDKQQQLLHNPEPIMSQSLNKIYNRDVFMLIDQSGSMTKRDADGNMKRWDSLKEIVMSHVDAILSKESEEDMEKICDVINIALFSRNIVRRDPILVKNVERVESIFIENRPDSTTFIAPTLSKCLDQWFSSRATSKTQGAFFIIYTDGQFDDTKAFEKLIVETCAKLEDESVIKILIIGIGKEVDREYFDKLDTKKNSDKNGNPCDIVVFDLATEMEDIIELMERQIFDTTAMRQGFSLKE